MMDDKSGVQESDIGAGNWLDFGVEERHLYRITVSEINGAGDEPHGMAKGDEAEDQSKMADHDGDFILDKEGAYWAIKELSFIGADGEEVQTQASLAMAESEAGPSNSADKAFDGGDSNYRSADMLDGWLQIQFTSPAPIASYKIKPVDNEYQRDRYSPASWTMTRSVDNGLTWSTIDTQSGILTWEKDEEKSYPLSVAAAGEDGGDA